MTSENPTNKKPAEEQASRSPCAAGCGFYGNPATKNLCSVCFKKMYPNEVEKSNDNNKNKSNDNNNNNGNDNNNDSNKIKEVDTEKKEAEKPKKKIQKKKNRCWKCNKKVTLAGQFKCKCGYVYCARCRYPDAHNCEFDWKKQHQDKLAKDNKIVAFSKLDKI